MDNMVDLNSLESVQDDTEQAQVENLEGVVTEQETTKEPGWIKQRVTKAVSKAVEEAERRVAAKYESMLQPIRESVLDRQAQDLVEAGEFKSIERAKEYVRLKGGADIPKVEEPIAEQTNYVAMARADLLAKQAEKISAKGVDVMQVLKSDKEIERLVLSGEWDFYDVAEHMEKKVPVPARSPNGASAGSMTIASMTKEQFQKLQQGLKEGKAFDMRK